MPQNRCPNYNHGRPNAPVRHCPDCGEIVNGDIPAMQCSETKHAIYRRQRLRYCMHCGEQLIK